ncbi:hypothetical protein ACFL6D_01170, partial [Spirochaetota bacterium]
LLVLVTILFSFSMLSASALMEAGANSFLFYGPADYIGDIYAPYGVSGTLLYFGYDDALSLAGAYQLSDTLNIYGALSIDSEKGLDVTDTPLDMLVETVQEGGQAIGSTTIDGGTPSVDTNVEDGDAEKAYTDPAYNIMGIEGTVGAVIQMGDMKIAIFDSIDITKNTKNRDYTEKDEGFLESGFAFGGTVGGGGSFSPDAYDDDDDDNSTVPGGYDITVNELSAGDVDYTVLDSRDSDSLENTLGIGVNLGMLAPVLVFALEMDPCGSLNTFGATANSTASNAGTTTAQTATSVLYTYEETYTGVDLDEIDAGEEGGTTIGLSLGSMLNINDTTKAFLSFSMNMPMASDDGLKDEHTITETFNEGADATGSALAGAWAGADQIDVGGSASYSMTTTATREYAKAPKDIMLFAYIKKAFSSDEATLWLKLAYTLGLSSSTYADTEVTVEEGAWKPDAATTEETRSETTTRVGPEIDKSDMSHTIQLPVAAKIAVSDKVDIIGGLKAVCTLTSGTTVITPDEQSQTYEEEITGATASTEESEVARLQEIETRTYKMFTVTKNGYLGLQYKIVDDTTLGLVLSSSTYGTVNATSISVDITKQF